MSQLNVNTIKNRTGTSGPVLSGLSTVSGSLVVSSDATVSGAATVTGALTVGGVLTYEDVTNVDSVGIITARTGLEVTANGLVINAGVSTFAADLSIADKIIHTGDTNTAIRFPAADTFSVETGGTEAYRVDSGQRLLIGATSDSNLIRHGQAFAVATTADFGGGSFTGFNGTTANEGPIIDLQRSRATSKSPGTVVASGDRLGSLVFRGDDGTDFADAAYMLGEVDGTPSGGFVPGRLTFYTGTTSSTPTERLRLDSAGRLLHGTTSSSSITSFVLQGNSDNSASAAGIFMQRGTATPPDGQELGNIYFADSGGGTGALILAKRDGGTWSGSSKPGRLEFHTTADGATSGTERMRIHNGGVVSIPNGIELGSGVDATVANTLDDYEEGTWTPSIGGNATYTTQAGNYIKVGTMVLAHFRLSINAKGTGSTIGAISGLPFSSAKASQNTSNLTWGSLGTNIIYGVYYVGSGSQTLNFSYSSSAAGSLTNNPDIFANGASINGTIMYISS